LYLLLTKKGESLGTAANANTRWPSDGSWFGISRIPVAYSQSMPFLWSGTWAIDIIALLVKLMSNEELIIVGQKVFNPLRGSQLGAKGDMSARLQPNSPTDNTDDIMMQVFDGWSYAAGDLLFGTNNGASIGLGLQTLLT